MFTILQSSIWLKNFSPKYKDINIIKVTADIYSYLLKNQVHYA